MKFYCTIITTFTSFAGEGYRWRHVSMGTELDCPLPQQNDICRCGLFIMRPTWPQEIYASDKSVTASLLDLLNSKACQLCLQKTTHEYRIYNVAELLLLQRSPMWRLDSCLILRLTAVTFFLFTFFSWFSVPFTHHMTLKQFIAYLQRRSSVSADTITGNLTIVMFSLVLLGGYIHKTKQAPSAHQRKTTAI